MYRSLLSLDTCLLLCHGKNVCRGTVAVFLSALDDVQDFNVLNEVICAWREDEQRTRDDCGLGPVESHYTGCPDYRNVTVVRRDRDLRGTTAANADRMSANDILLRNMLHRSLDPDADIKTIYVDHDRKDGTADPTINTNERQLLYNFSGTETPEFNSYFALQQVQTEYYYRYSGTQTIPPCYGTFYPGDNRKQTNHWRYEQK